MANKIETERRPPSTEPSHKSDALGKKLCSVGTRCHGCIPVHTSHGAGAKSCALLLEDGRRGLPFFYSEKNLQILIEEAVNADNSPPMATATFARLSFVCMVVVIGVAMMKSFVPRGVFFGFALNVSETRSQQLNSALTLEAEGEASRS